MKDLVNVVVIEQALLDLISVLCCQVVNYPEGFADNINLMLPLILVRKCLFTDRRLEDGDKLLEGVRVSQ